MLAFFLTAYRNNQLKKLERRLHENAMIGEMFDFCLDSHISNESGDKARVVIGSYCRMLGAIFCKSQGKVQVGNYSVIQNNVRIECLNSVTIGHYCGIGMGVAIRDNNNHAIGPEDRVAHRIRAAPGGPGYPGLGDGWELSESAPVVIENVAWIGSNSLVLKGVTIGEAAVVAAHSVVTKDVLPYTIVAGNPARAVKTLEKPKTKYYQL